MSKKEKEKEIPLPAPSPFLRVASVLVGVGMFAIGLAMVCHAIERFVAPDLE